MAETSMVDIITKGREEIWDFIIPHSMKKEEVKKELLGLKSPKQQQAYAFAYEIRAKVATENAAIVKKVLAEINIK